MQAVFESALNNKSKLTLSSEFEKVNGWDSLGHMKIISTIEKKLSISFEIDEIIGINTVKKLINLTKKKNYVMSSLYKIFLKNIKKSPKKIFIYTEKKNFDGDTCKQKISYLRKFIVQSKIKVLGINYKNSSDWIFWYLAADACGIKIVLIKNSASLSELKLIKIKYEIDYVAKKITNNLRFKIKNEKNKKKIRKDILFTSGTIGMPKGVILSEKSFLHVANILTKKLKQKENDIELLSMPFDHSFGLVRLRCCILAGTKMLVTDGLKNFPEVYKFSKVNKLSGLSLVPSGLVLLKLLLKDKVKLFSKNIKYLEIGSSYIDNDVRKWLKKFSKYHNYSSLWND